MKQITMM